MLVLGQEWFGIWRRIVWEDQRMDLEIGLEKDVAKSGDCLGV